MLQGDVEFLKVLEKMGLKDMIGEEHIYDSKVKAIKKAPNYIQCTYQRLYELGIKKLEEIPFDIRINLKAK